MTKFAIGLCSPRVFRSYRILSCSTAIAVKASHSQRFWGCTLWLLSLLLTFPMLILLLLFVQMLLLPDRLHVPPAARTLAD